MKVVVLHGSHRVGGNSDALAERVLAGLGGVADLDVVHFRPIDMKIAHCRGCGRCRTGGGCVIDDDMRTVYPAFCDADVVILAAPMFWGYMTSQLKTLFDRLEAIVSPRCFGGKQFVLLVTYRHYYGSMVEWMERISTGFGSRCRAIVCRTYDSASERDLEIEELPEMLQAAHDLGATLALGS